MKVRHLVSVLIAVAMAGSIGFAGAQVKPSPVPAPAATEPPLDPAVVKANMEKVQQQVVLANRLADRFQGDAATQFGASFNAIDWKRTFGSSLMYQPVASLSAALTAPNLSMVQSEFYNAAGRAAVAPKHASSNDWTLHLLTPCRIVDTRVGGGGALTGWRDWAASAPAATIAAQGGNSGGCGTFPNADGFLLYVTVIPPGSFGGGGANFLTVQHDQGGGGAPSASTMNYYPGDNIANFAITADCTGCIGVNDGFSVYASGTTHVAIDLVGWAGRAGPQALDCLTTATATSGLIANAAWGSVTIPSCPAGYTLTGSFCGTSSLHNLLTDTGLAGFCGMWNETGASQTVSGSARCCRLPVITADTPGG